MKVENNDDNKTLSKYGITALIILIVIVIATLVCFTATVLAPNRTTKSNRYDLNCITKMSGRPLEDCRIESDKCLFEVEGTNTYELRPWEDCEE